MSLVNATCEDIYSLLQPYCDSPEYAAKMLHVIPAAEVVEREIFVINRCKGKRVINFGSTSGPLHGYIKRVATEAWGVDKDGEPDYRMDFDEDYFSLQILPQADVYLCGEIIEHLLAPGFFLKRVNFHMKHRGAEGAVLIVTVPNAGSFIKSQSARRGIENVNRDHNYWFSYRTLRTLLEKCGFSVKEFYWYGGKPVFSEGLVMVAA